MVMVMIIIDLIDEKKNGRIYVLKLLKDSSFTELYIHQMGLDE